MYEVHRDRSGAVTSVAKSNLSLKGHKGSVTAVAFSPDASRAVTASKDGHLIVWNLDVRYQLHEDAKQLSHSVQVGGLPHVLPAASARSAAPPAAGRQAPHARRRWTREPASPAWSWGPASGRL